jgi:hypothetical protein
LPEALFERGREGIAVLEKAAHQDRLIAHVPFEGTQELAFEQARELQAGHRNQDDDGVDEQEPKVQGAQAALQAA